jgi:hypothetical protein
VRDEQTRTTTFRGKSDVPLKEVAKALGVSYSLVYSRCAMGKSTGDDVERENYTLPKSPLLTIDGVTRTICEWYTLNGIDQRTVSTRMKRGWPAEKAVSWPVKRQGKDET